MTLELSPNIKYAVQAVLLNEEGKVLAVSRKDDHNNFGLPGGKVESIDPSFEYAIIREVKEETGLDIEMHDSEIILTMHKNGYMGYTYLIRTWSGNIDTEEPHAVSWEPFSTIIDGSFGVWNKMVYDSLRSMGIKPKL